MTSEARAVKGSHDCFSSIFHWESAKTRVRRAFLFMGLCFSVGLLFSGLFYVWTSMQLVQIGYEISALEAKNRDLKNRKRELLLEIASLQSPGELEKKARRQGLVFPSMEQVVHVP